MLKHFVAMLKMFKFYTIVLMVQQNYFLICPTKFLDTSAKPFFPCMLS